LPISRLLIFPPTPADLSVDISANCSAPGDFPAIVPACFLKIVPTTPPISRRFHCRFPADVKPISGRFPCQFPADVPTDFGRGGNIEHGWVLAKSKSAENRLSLQIQQN
jgi:hypothetical protein